jgi:23S rRNA (uridine2552-2'-O)-methyltransferase
VLRADVSTFATARPVPGGASEASAAAPVYENAPYDVVLSDMAPSTSGSKISDQARSFDLFMKALDIATSLGKPGSSFVGKIFMSDDFPKAKNAVAERYSKARVIRPEGTRSGSSEIFIVGLGLKSRT